MSEASRAIGNIGSFFGRIGNFFSGTSISGNIAGPSGITGTLGPGMAGSLNLFGDSGLTVSTRDEGQSVRLGPLTISGDLSDVTSLPNVSLGPLSMPGTGQDFIGRTDVSPGPGYSPNIGSVGPISPIVNPGSGIRPSTRAEAPAPPQRTEAEMRAQRVGRARAAELLRLERRRGATPRASVRGVTKAASGASAAQKSRAGGRLPRPNASTLLGLGNKQATARMLLG